MKRKLVALLLVPCLCFGLVGCSQAFRASYNVSQQADNFNVLRQLTVLNNMSNEILFQMTGKFSITVDSADSQLEVIVENEDGSYSKHFVGLNNMTTYTVIDLDNNYVDRYKFTINFNPNMLIPYSVETIQ